MLIGINIDGRRIDSALNKLLNTKDGIKTTKLKVGPGLGNYEVSWELELTKETAQKLMAMAMKNN